MPDDRRFAVLWMSEKAAAALFDLDGAFNSVSLKLIPGSSETDAIDRLDRLLARYGGTGAYGRKDQLSHAFLDAELKQLDAMRCVIPPIFLLVSAFLINLTLTRMIALEREQIGLLKAIGYGPLPIAAHYVKLVLAIVSVGIALGFLADAWLGYGLARLYAVLSDAQKKEADDIVLPMAGMGAPMGRPMDRPTGGGDSKLGTPAPSAEQTAGGAWPHPSQSGRDGRSAGSWRRTAWPSPKPRRQKMPLALPWRCASTRSGNSLSPSRRRPSRDEDVLMRNGTPAGAEEAAHAYVIARSEERRTSLV